MEGIWQDGKFILQSTLESRLDRLQKDALTMALRLMGEDEDSFSPECREVMERWRPKCLEAIKEAAKIPKKE
jgi:hypothetical protein